MYFILAYILLPNWFDSRLVVSHVYLHIRHRYLAGCVPSRLYVHTFLWYVENARSSLRRPTFRSLIAGIVTVTDARFCLPSAGRLTTVNCCRNVTPMSLTKLPSSPGEMRNIECRCSIIGCHNIRCKYLWKFLKGCSVPIEWHVWTLLTKVSSEIRPACLLLKRCLFVWGIVNYHKFEKVCKT